MCRIAGIVDHSNHPIEQQIQLMTAAMRRGGPDDAGIYSDEQWPLVLGHRRLSLLDLSPLGHQPMLSQSGNIVLVFNGEIYNFQEIKAELLAKGYSFISHSDTEVIIYAYQEWGIHCFKRFNGMFALALLDKITGKLLLARDHAGIKPLYYSINNNKLIFASEIRAFKTLIPDWQENSDWKKYFLLFGHLPEPVTTLTNVQPLTKGTVLEVDLATLATQEHSFFQLYYNYTIQDTAAAVKGLQQTLNASVQRHLISDAPIGLFLSGGIDSSLLTALAKPFVGDNLHTLSIVFDNEKYSEKYYQDLIIQQTGAKHRSFVVDEQTFFDSLPDILDAMDQPSSDGINTYFICKYAREMGLKAVLSGLGADELFGGYQSFYRTSAVQTIGRLPNFALAVAGIFPDDKRKRVSFLALKNGLGEYLFNRGFFTPAQVAVLLDCSEQEVQDLLLRFKQQLPAFITKLDEQERVSYLETNLYMQNQLLKDTDYMSMWHGIEVRVPFLDKALMELVYSISPSIRYNKKQIKHLLAQAFAEQLPKAIWERPKQGFVFPFEEWMQHIQPATMTAQAEQLQKSMQRKQLHWSRYWSYLLGNTPGNSFTITP